MGLYNVVCQGCQKRFQWFSGAVNQLCEQCNDKLVNDSNDNKSIFSKLTEQEMHDLLNPHAKAGRIIDALEKERDALKTELTKCKQALEQTNDGRPSEWAYSILRKERDELKAHLRDATDYNLELKAEVERLKFEPLFSQRLVPQLQEEIDRLKEKDIAAWETASHWEKEADRLEVILQFEKTKSATLEAEVVRLKGELASNKKHWEKMFDEDSIDVLEFERRLQGKHENLTRVTSELASEKAKSAKYREALEQIARQDHRVHILSGQRIARLALQEDK